MTTSRKEPDDAADRSRLNRLERLYQEARPLAESARVMFLDERCADDPMLRGELESLLAHADEAEDFMEALGQVGESSDPADVAERLNDALEGRYRIERQIGQGGMATVYVADDLRHDRKVALKVLKSELAAIIGAERFLREIQTTASLQHPHILPLFDSGEADGFLYYVMPYVKGDSLRDRLRRERQLPVDEAVAIATQVASALDYAHEVGIVHRDIKPANILLSPGGPVVADFGIALALSAAGRGRLTQTGLSLGTPHYMSPEQATGGGHIGPHTDIYALGCVLYEMLIGEPPYTGTTPQAVLGKILRAEPVSPAEERKSVPLHVDSTIRRALEKLPADRFRTAGDLATALADAAFRHRSLAGPGRLPRTRGPSTGTAVAAALVFATLAAWGWFGRRPLGSPAPVWRTDISLDGDHRIAVADYEALPLAISPRGDHVVYVGESPPGRQLYVRPRDSYESVPLPGTDEARQPFFSPDGHWVAYFSGGGLFRVAITGGVPIRIAELPSQAGSPVPAYPVGGAWGPDDLIVFAAADRLWRIERGAVRPEAIQLFLVPGEDTEGSGDDPSGEGEVRLGGTGWPVFLPSRRDGGPGDPTVLVNLEGELSAVSVESGATRRLGVSASGHVRYAAPGHLLYTAATGVARAVPFDLATLRVTGAPVPVLENVFRANISSATFLALSRDGTLIYVPGGSRRTLVRVDREGRERPLPFDPADYRFPTVSPEGNRIVVARRRTGTGIVDLVLMDLTSGGERRIVSSVIGVWSPDGESIAFDVGGDVPRRIRLTAGASSEPLFQGPMPRYPMGWGADGRLLLQDLPKGTSGIFLAVPGANEPEVVIDSPYDERYADRSPDGQLIAYTSDVSGKKEVYVRGLARGDEPVQVSVNGGTNPLWSRSGREFFYRRAEQVYAVQVTSFDPIEVSAPELLFTGRYMGGVASWDAFPAGDFLMISAGPHHLRRIRVVQNLVGELRERSAGS